MNQFYEAFWSGPMYDEWLAENVAEDMEAQEAFYAKYEDQFFTEYSVSYPDEDIAEAWVYFLFSTAEEVEMYDGVLKEKLLFYISISSSFDRL
ncbi:hypothetical protein [Domibacillus antri]|uniref:hypothetical protein n=1 Tax=Domibacillus antri TaxID=1714264 RepID=UPI0009F9885B|nr:hypothetical protein [Domibacillus antri]